MQDKDNTVILDEKSESRLYVGNLDMRITEAALIKMFSPFGKIVCEDYLWHTCGPKRGEPRGYAFVQFSTKEEAKLAKEKMQGKLACGRPLDVRFARDKYFVETEGKVGKLSGESNKSNRLGNGPGQTSRNAKIAAIKNKLKAMEEEDHDRKRQKQS
ncbi:uncharacterized protein LOC143620222 isoform X1 [Bidens hawaiensis]|uniref:uncharacterized protein LOC143620222 isoform X1 n=1 Tax=Bidens hawaiensis TaxID=980011 RepID=UPI004049789C